MHIPLVYPACPARPEPVEGSLPAVSLKAVSLSNLSNPSKGTKPKGASLKGRA